MDSLTYFTLNTEQLNDSKKMLVTRIDISSPLQTLKCAHIVVVHIKEHYTSYGLLLLKVNVLASRLISWR